MAYVRLGQFLLDDQTGMRRISLLDALTFQSSWSEMLKRIRC